MGCLYINEDGTANYGVRRSRVLAECLRDTVSTLQTTRGERASFGAHNSTYEEVKVGHTLP